MGSYDDQARTRPWNAGDDAGLVIGVGKLRDCDGRVGGRDGFDQVEERGAGLGAIGGAVVSIEEAGGEVET